MAREISGTGRVTVFPLLHMWPDVWGVAAYATTGHFGTTAAVGYIPIADVPDMSLLDVGARHSGINADRSAHAEWVLCTAWSSRTVAKPGAWDLPSAKWALDWDARAEPKGNQGNMYGHSELYVGRFHFLSDETTTDDKGNTRILDDEVRMKQARELLPQIARR
ncbi:hypothetical protein ACGFYZ_12750 [Streptomyces sp. NPDC048330]|uniref:hypothetical protein n=1 Tax=Streptomyces sp. NPDC048330 TaxID=3365533 RepID=UPI003717D856